MLSILSIQMMRLSLIGLVIVACLNPKRCSAISPPNPAPALQERSIEFEKQLQDFILQLDETDTKSERDQIIKLIETHIDKATQAQAVLAINMLSNPPNGMRNQTKLLLTQIKRDLEVKLNAKETKETLVTLQGTYSLSEVLAKLTEQTDVEFKLAFQPDETRNRFSLMNTPFWSALDQALDKFQTTVSDLPLNSSTETNGLVIKRRIQASPTRVGSANYFGIIRGEVRSFQSIRNFKNKSLNVDKLTVQLAWLPSFQPYKFSLDMASIKGVDSNGEKLDVASSEKQTFNLPIGKQDVKLTIPLQQIRRTADSIQSLSGNLELSIPTGNESFEFADLQNLTSATAIRKANTVLTMESFEATTAARRDKKSGEKIGLYSAKISYAVSDSGDAFESHNGWMFRRQVFIVDKNKRKILPKRSLTLSQQSNKIGFDFLFELPDGPQGCKFVYVAPTSIRNVPIQFDFRDIELR